MLNLPVLKPTFLGDEIILKSIDWLENFPWNKENSVLNDADKYEICLNVKDFSYDEIEVKTSDGLLIIEAKHDDKKDEYGYISRHFVRKYRMPEGCVLEEVHSRLTPEGLLVVSAPRKVAKDKLLPVTHLKKKLCGFKL